MSPTSTLSASFRCVLTRCPLPADCTESQLTGRVAQVTANLNPYLGTYALKGLELSRFIINSLPKSLSQTQLALLRRLKTDPASCANYQDILSECCEAIRLTRDKSIPVPVLGVFGANGIAYTPPKKDKPKPPIVGAAGDAGDAKDSAKGKKEKEKEGGGSRKGGGGDRRDSGRTTRNKLPPGEKCATGTCEYKHTGVCWRDPRVEVTFPATMSNQGSEGDHPQGP